MAETLTIRTASSTEVVKIAVQGPQGPAGQGVPTGGTTGQVLRKASGSDYDTEWAAAGSGSGSVTSVALASSDFTISGSPITDAGTITANLGNSGVTAGTYTKVTVDAKGRVTTGATATTSDIGAQSAQEIETIALSASVTLTASRNKLWKISNNSVSSYYVELPTTGISVGDIAEIEYTSATGRLLEIRRDGVALGQSLPNNTRNSYRADTSAPNGWTPLALNYSNAGFLFFTQADVLLGRQGTSGQAQEITCTAAGRDILDDTDAAAQRTTLGLGTAAVEAASAFAPASHTHGNITNGGLVGTVANLPLKTGTGGIVEAGAFGTSAGQFAEGNHTHSQLHDRSHAITSNSDHTAGNHKIFYSDGSGQVQELALGSNGTVLTSNGATSAPSFAAASGGISAVGASVADILSVSGSDLVADDPNADRLIFFDDSAGKLTHLTVGSGLTITDTTLSATSSFDPASPGAIGGTTPSTGAFTSLSTAPAANTSALTSTGYSLTGSNAQSLVDLAGTWNTTGTPSAIKLNVTDTASNANSLLMQLQTGGTNRFTVSKTGAIIAPSIRVNGAQNFSNANAGVFTASNYFALTTAVGGMIIFGSTFYGHDSGGGVANFTLGNVGGGSGCSGLQMTTTGSISFGGTSSTAIIGESANVLSQRAGTSAQEKQIYGTYTSSTNYQRMTIKSVKQTLSALSGASATTTGTFIPDGAVVVGVTTRVATALTGATGYQVGDGTDADRWGDITGTAIGTTSDNRDWTAGTIECFTAGGEITLTAKTSNFTAGAIEICVFYLAGQAD